MALLPKLHTSAIDACSIVLPTYAWCGKKYLIYSDCRTLIPSLQIGIFNLICWRFLKLFKFNISIFTLISYIFNCSISNFYYRIRIRRVPLTRTDSRNESPSEMAMIELQIETYNRVHLTYCGLLMKAV